MSAKIQQFGRAAAIRALLLDRPAGASDEELLASGTLTCTLKQLNSSLAAMRDTGQVQVSITKGNRVWMLTWTSPACWPDLCAPRCWPTTGRR